MTLWALRSASSSYLASPFLHSSRSCSMTLQWTVKLGIYCLGQLWCGTSRRGCMHWRSKIVRGKASFQPEDLTSVMSVVHNAALPTFLLAALWSLSLEEQDLPACIVSKYCFLTGCKSATEAASQKTLC